MSSRNQLLGAALGLLAGVGTKGYANAKRINDYAGRMGVNYDVGNFEFGDPSQDINAVNALYKGQIEARQNQAQLDDINAHLNPGMRPFSNVEAAKTFYSGASVPEWKSTMEHDRQVAAANPLRDLVNTSPGMFFPGAGGVKNAEGYSDGIIDSGNGAPMLQTGAGKMSGLPDLSGMTSDEIMKVIQTNRETSGENRAWNTDARAQAEESRKVELHPVEKVKKQLEADKIRQEISRLKQILQYNPRLFEARIASLNRSNRQSGGRSGGKLDKLGYLIQSGVPDEDIVSWIMNGEDTSTTTTTYDAQGNPKSSRVSTRSKGSGRNGASVPTRGTSVKGEHGTYNF